MKGYHVDRNGVVFRYSQSGQTEYLWIHEHDDKPGWYYAGETKDGPYRFMASPVSSLELIETLCSRDIPWSVKRVCVFIW